jgi:hypothetical protein
MEGNCVFKFYFEDKKGVAWGILSWSRVEMCCSLNCCQHFPYKWQEFFDTNFGTSCLRRDSPTRWIFQEGCIEKEIAIVQNLWHFNKDCLQNCLVQNHGDFDVNLHDWQARKQKRV